MAKQRNGHGGKRAGAGRPKGSRMRRSEVLADELIAAGKCPVQALVRLAEQAEVEGDVGQAIGAWKSILPYVYPKPLEIEPKQVIDLARDLAAARVDANRGAVAQDHVALLERALAEMS